MIKENKELYKNYFGEEPKIVIDFDEAEIYIQLLKEKILKKNYNSIYELKKDLNIFDKINQKIKNIETTVTEIENDK